MTSLTRIAPALPMGRRADRMIERSVMTYRRTWLVLCRASSNRCSTSSDRIRAGRPDRHGARSGRQPIPYAVFVAPGLLATSAMNGAVYESTFNIFFKLRYAKTYDAVLATPMGVDDIAVGEIGWSLIRGGLYAVGFLVVIVLLGLAASPLAVLCVPAALLIGFAFAAVGMAGTTWIRSWQDFDFVIVITLPLFLFSATFYPITAYPDGLRLLVEITPLYQGVAMLRQLTTGAVDPSLLVHIAYLTVMGVVGLFVVSRRLDRLLLK